MNDMAAALALSALQRERAELEARVIAAEARAVEAERDREHFRAEYCRAYDKSVELAQRLEEAEEHAEHLALSESGAVARQIAADSEAQSWEQRALAAEAEVCRVRREGEIAVAVIHRRAERATDALREILSNVRAGSSLGAIARIARLAIGDDR